MMCGRTRTEKNVRFVDYYPLNIAKVDLRPVHNPLPTAIFLAFGKLLVPPVPARHLQQLGRCADEHIHGMAGATPRTHLELAFYIVARKRAGHLRRRNPRLGPAGNVRARRALYAQTVMMGQCFAKARQLAHQFVCRCQHEGAWAFAGRLQTLGRFEVVQHWKEIRE